MGGTAHDVNIHGTRCMGLGAESQALPTTAAWQPWLLVRWELRCCWIHSQGVLRVGMVVVEREAEEGLEVEVPAVPHW
jgi:hypothetical protein